MASLGYAAATAAGPVRSTNEDSIVAARTILTGGDTTLVCGVIAPDTEALFAVADGIGGHPFGEVASRIIVSSLADDPPAATEPSCTAAVRRTNLELHAVMAQRPETVGMGAVLAGVVCHGVTSCWFNVGDSRIYHCVSDGRLIQLSVDDTTAAPPLSRRPGMVSTALGGRRTIAPINPHTGSAVLAAGDRLMLCSDGVINALPDEAIAAIIHVAATPEAAVRDLMDACRRGMARDNLSVVVIGGTAR